MAEMCIQWHAVLTLQMLSQYDDVKCTLVILVFHDATKHGCDHHCAVNSIEFCLKTRHHTIPASRFVVEQTIGGSLLSDGASRVVEVMVDAASNFVELLVRKLFVLQTT